MMKASTNLGDSNSHCVTINATGNVTFTQVQTAQLPAQKSWFRTQPLGRNNHLSLLRWDRRVCERVGRDAEFEELLAWTDDGDPGIEARLITGDGGTGKSRLAGDLAQKLVKRGWRAEKLADRLTEQVVLPLGGFQPREGKGTLAERTPTRQSVAKPADKGGLLIVIDYPEGRMPLVERLLESLRDYAMQEDIRVRLLLLSRRDSQEWYPVIERARAEGLFQTDAIHLGRSIDPGAQFITVLTGLATALKQAVPVLPAGEPEKWLANNRAYQQPLFMAAVALHFCLHPEAGLTLGGPEAVTALVHRERSRAENESIGLGWEPDTLPRLLALATLRGGLDSAKLNELGRMLGVPAGPDLSDRLRHGCDGRIRDNVLLPLEPDLPGAAFATLVLSKRADKAPDWIWQTIADNPMGLIPRLEQVCHDAEGTLQLLPESRISRLLTAMVKDDLERAQALEYLAFSDGQSHRLASLAAMVCEVLLNCAELNDAERASLLSNRSAYLAETGDAQRALHVIQEAKEIYQKLADESPDQFETSLAQVLNNLSGCLSSAGDRPGALDAIRQAVEIRQRLATNNPGSFNPELAICLHNLSSSLSKIGDDLGALNASRKAVEIYEMLVAEEPGLFNPNLAASLNSLSSRLSAAGDDQGALDASRKSLEIRQKLAATSPARFNPVLASSLTNLSNRLSRVGNEAGALDSIWTASELYRKLAKESPSRFNPDLASCLNNLSSRLSSTGDGPGALDAIREAVEIRRNLAADNPSFFNPVLAGSLAVLAQLTFEAGEQNEAVSLMEEAITLITPQAKAYPDSQAGRWLSMMQADLARFRATPSPGTPTPP